MSPPSMAADQKVFPGILLSGLYRLLNYRGAAKITNLYNARTVI